MKVQTMKETKKERDKGSETKDGMAVTTKTYCTQANEHKCSNSLGSKMCQYTLVLYLYSQSSHKGRYSSRASCRLL